MSAQNPTDHSKPSQRIALVTGGSRGLGRNIASHLANSGYDIVLTYRSQKEEGAAAVAEIEKLGRRAVALQLDVAEVKSFSAFREKFAGALQETWQTTQFQALKPHCCPLPVQMARPEQAVVSQLWQRALGI